MHLLFFLMFSTVSLFSHISAFNPIPSFHFIWTYFVMSFLIFRFRTLTHYFSSCSFLIEISKTIHFHMTMNIAVSHISIYILIFLFLSLKSLFYNNCIFTYRLYNSLHFKTILKVCNIFGSILVIHS